jgi:cell division protein FtsA
MKRVKRSLLTKIIQDRVEEILAEVQQRLRKSGFDVAAGRRAVLTGGGCQLAGVGDVVSRVLGKQVRIGRPSALPGLPAATTAPAYATALGLLIAGAASTAEIQDPNPRVEARPEKRGLLRSLGFG